MNASSAAPRPLPLYAGSLLVSLILAATAAFAAEPETMERVQTIPLKGVEGVCNVFDGRTYELVKSLEFAGADNVRYDPRTKQVYVGHTKYLSAIDAKSLKVKEIKLPGPGKAFQLHPTKPRLYVNTHDPF